MQNIYTGNCEGFPCIDARCIPHHIWCGNKMENYDTLVLSGNSTNALSHLGAIQRLFDSETLKQDSITHFYGTSSGSLICTLLAVGFEPIEILANICANGSYSKISGINLANITNGCVMNFDPIERELEELIETKLGYVPTIGHVKEHFGKTLVFVTYNISVGKKQFLTPETFPDLLVTTASRMSSSFPFVFAPYKYQENFYIDGGIVENFPMMTAQMAGRKCFGIFNNNPVKPYTPEMSYIELFFRLITVFVSSSADNIVAFDGSKILKLSYEPSFFNFSSNNFALIEMFNKGYDAAAK